MPVAYERYPYQKLNPRQQEAYNFQKVSAVLADYGFVTIRLSSDWRGADFIAQHIDGITFLKVQLKGRPSFDKKYLDRDLFICFCHAGTWFLYPHDAVLTQVLAAGLLEGTQSWDTNGQYHFPTLTKQLKVLLEPYRLEMTNSTLTIDDDDPLSSYAGRIKKVLSEPAVSSNPDLAGSLDDFLGAIYALIMAKHHQFQDRTSRPIDIKPVAERAARIASGLVRTDGQWVAGFYFNNTLFRTAAVYHRILKTIVGKDAYVPVLRPIVQALYPGWASVKLDLVHSQVNDLKHTPRGIHDQRTVTYSDAVAAAGELLDLIEAWTAANSPSTGTP